MFDLVSVRKTLQHGIDRGYWTLEQLDKPPTAHLNKAAYRNLLRDEPLEPRVEVTAPRDFVPPSAHVPAEAEATDGEEWF